MEDGPSDPDEARTGSHRKAWIALVLAAAGFVGVAVANSVTDRIVNEAADVVLDTSSPLASEAASGPDLLVAKQDWPESYLCQVLVGSGSATRPQASWHDVPGQFQDLPGRDAVKGSFLRDGGGPIGWGILTLWLTTAADVPLFVTDIQVDIYSRSAEEPARWAVPLMEQCGGDVEEREFFVDFDAPRPVVADRGVRGGYGDDSEIVPREALGPSFTINKKKPTRLLVTVNSCESTVRWGLRINYFAEGQNRTLLLGGPDSPYVTFAGNSPANVLSSDGALHPLVVPYCLGSDLRMDYDAYPESARIM